MQWCLSNELSTDPTCQYIAPRNSGRLLELVSQLIRRALNILSLDAQIIVLCPLKPVDRFAIWPVRGVWAGDATIGLDQTTPRWNDFVVSCRNANY